MSGGSERLSRVNLRDLVPGLKDAAYALFNIANSVGANPRFTSGFRTYAEQNRLFQLRQAGRWPYPVAAPGTSAHEFGYAVDIVVPDNTNQQDMGTVWTEWGYVYGGKSDPVHFEWPGFTHRVPSSTDAVDPNAALFGKPGTVWDQLADAILLQLATRGAGLPARILSKTFLASGLYQIFGGQEALPIFYLSHPVELLRDVYSILRLFSPIRPLLG